MTKSKVYKGMNVMVRIKSNGQTVVHRDGVVNSMTKDGSVYIRFNHFSNNGYDTVRVFPVSIDKDKQFNAMSVTIAR